MSSILPLPVSASSTPATSSVDAKQSVLLVEDNETVAKLVITILSRAQIPVIWANDAAEGLRRFDAQQAEIGAAFVDWSLPDARGHDFCHRLRERAPSLPLMLTSGRRQDVTVNISPEEHIDFVPKPYRPSELLGLMRAKLKMAA